MFEITRYAGRRRARGTVVLAVGIGLFSLLIVGIFPNIAASGVDFEAYVESLPPAIREGFVGDASAITTIEGFLATELYQFMWLLLLGLYLGYAAGAVVAADVESGRMDMVLAAPIARSRLLVEKFLSLLVPVLALNLIVPLFVYGGVVAIEESIDVTDLVAVHLLSVPYLLACAGIGVVLSTLVDRADVAQRGAIAAVFGLFVLDTVTTDTDFEWLGVLSPTRYYSPSEILVEEQYDLAGAGLLLLAALALLAVAVVVFRERDL